MARTKRTPVRSYPAIRNTSTAKPSTTSTSSQGPAAPVPVPLRRSDSVKFGRNGDPVVPAEYDDPLSKSINYNGKAYSTTPARATDEEIKDDLTQMRKTRDGRPYGKPASPKEPLPEFDNYGYEVRIIKKLKSKLESNIHHEPPTGEELVNGSQPKDEEAGVSIETSDTRATPKKAIPARARRTAARKAQCAGGERVIKTARVGKASVMDKSVFKAAPPAIPAGAKTFPANTEKPAGEPATVSQSFSVVIFTRASSRGTTRKDKYPTATSPEAEGPIREMLTDQEDKSSTSSESGDDMEKDGNYSPVATRKRRVAHKGKAPVASRKRAAPNEAVAPPRRNVRRKTAAPEEAITRATTTPAEIRTTLTKENVKPAAGTKKRGRRNANAPEAEATAQKEAGPPAAPDVDAALTTEKPTSGPTTDSLRGEIAVPEEHAPPATVSETPVGAVEAATPATTSAPPVRVRGPRYRIPAEGSRKSTRIKAQHDKLK